MTAPLYVTVTAPGPGAMRPASMRSWGVGVGWVGGWGCGAFCMRMLMCGDGSARRLVSMQDSPHKHTRLPAARSRRLHQASHAHIHMAHAP